MTRATGAARAAGSATAEGQGCELAVLAVEVGALDRAVGEATIRDNCLAVGAIGIHRVNAVPLSSRTNSWPERVVPEEVFDLVASIVVIVFPSVS